MTIAYTKLLDLNGEERADMVLAADGTGVLTGRMRIGADVVDVAVEGDAKPTEAYRAWLAAGNEPGEPVSAEHPRTAYGYAILNALTDDERTASLSASVKTWDRLMIQARPTPFPETNEKVRRFAKGVGTTPKSLFDRALRAGA